jgi:hypothetical protein
MDIKAINPNIWITVSQSVDEIADYYCIRKTDVLNLDNGCIMRETVIERKFVVVNLEFKQNIISQSTQFIPDININLNENGEIIQNISKYSSILQPIYQYVPGVTHYEPPTTIPFKKEYETTWGENINVLDDNRISCCNDPKCQKVDTSKLQK